MGKLRRIQSITYLLPRQGLVWRSAELEKLEVESFFATGDETILVEEAVRCQVCKMENPPWIDKFVDESDQVERENFKVVSRYL